MFYIIFSILLIPVSHAQSPADIEEANKNYCRSLIDQGNYKSSGDQIFCHHFFDMAPAYLIKCMGFELEGFPTALDEKACELYLSELEDWGPWEDYIPHPPIEDLLKAYRDSY